MPEPTKTAVLPRWLAPLAVALFGGGVLALVLRDGDQGPSSRAVASAPSAERAAAPAWTAAEPDARAAPPSADAVEASLMRRLHELAEKDPSAALRLALEGNARFPASADAPERGWIICRSLVKMQRFDEAVAEARLVVERYPGTPWANDVERHLLVNPMTDPAERGYGKQNELE